MAPRNQLSHRVRQADVNNDEGDVERAPSMDACHGPDRALQCLSVCVGAACRVWDYPPLFVSSGGGVFLCG